MTQKQASNFPTFGMIPSNTKRLFLVSTGQFSFKG